MSDDDVGNVQDGRIAELPRLYTEEEVEAHFGATKREQSADRQKGLLKGAKFGRKWKYTVAQLEAYHEAKINEAVRRISTFQSKQIANASASSGTQSAGHHELKDPADLNRRRLAKRKSALMRRSASAPDWQN